MVSVKAIHRACTVVERRKRYQCADQMPRFDNAAVRHVEHMALGTPYPAVVMRVGEIVGCRELAGRCSLAVDATGVGAPVVDMLRERGWAEIEAMELISRTTERRGLPEPERYADMEDYDPVLRWHCRM